MYDVIPSPCLGNFCYKRSSQVLRLFTRISAVLYRLLACSATQVLGPVAASLDATAVCIESNCHQLSCICRQHLLCQEEAAQPSLPQQGCPLKAAQTLPKQPVQQQPLLTTMGLHCCTWDLERGLEGCSQWRWMMTPCFKRNSPRLAKLTLHK